MAGTFPGCSNTQQHDINGQPLANCILTVYQGGTTQLAATFQDIGLVIPATNPLVADATGRIPLFFVQDGSYALRLTDQNGIQSNGGFFYPQIPSIGASSSGGGGTPVDPSTVASTGDLKWRLENTTIAGWVRINGRTIGNASSGASERANADTQALFIYVWQTYADALCPVVGGRGAGALADFNAGKQITLLDARASGVFGLDDMGNAASGAFTGVPVSDGSVTTGGSSVGTNSAAITLAQLPAGITSNGSAQVSPAGGLNFALAQSVVDTSVSFTGSGFHIPQASGSGWSGTATINGSASVQSNNTGGQPFPVVPSVLLGTLFWKL